MQDSTNPVVTTDQPVAQPAMTDTPVMPSTGITATPMPAADVTVTPVPAVDMNTTVTEIAAPEMGAETVTETPAQFAGPAAVEAPEIKVELPEVPAMPVAAETPVTPTPIQSEPTV